MTVVEGGTPGYIELKATLPPEYFCVNRTLEDGPESCEISAWGWVEMNVATLLRSATTELDLQCYESGEYVSQAVFGYEPSYPDDYRRTCGIRVKADNWKNVMRIPVHGMIDGLVDGDRTRNVHVHHQVEYKTVSVYDYELGYIEVKYSD